MAVARALWQPVAWCAIAGLPGGCALADRVLAVYSAAVSGGMSAGAAAAPALQSAVAASAGGHAGLVTPHQEAAPGQAPCRTR